MGGRRYPLRVAAHALLETGHVSDPSPAAMERQRMLRASYAVHFYSGRNGTGKSAWAIFDTIPDLEAGRTVLSTVRLLDYNDPRPCEGWVREGVVDGTLGDCPVCMIPGHKPHGQAHPGYVPFREWPQLLELGKAGWDTAKQSDAVCLMDEITGVADSAEGGMPSMVANELAQLRRAGVVLRITGLNFIRASKRIREACVGVTRCESFLPVDAYDDAGRSMLWRPRRLTTARTYDAKSLPLDDIKESHWEAADLMVKSRAWIPWWPAITAYDTLAPVDRVGTVSDAGVCAHCAGNRRRHDCICDDYTAERARRKGAAGADTRSVEHRRPSRRVLPVAVVQ